MSLWKNTTDNPISAPTWYARHCYFDGTKVVDGTINLKDANTQFKVGDALLYVAPTDSEALGGLTTNTVYYVLSNEDNNYAISTTRDGDSAGPVATSEASTQMFIKCDTYDTTENGTLNYAVIPVTIEEAQSGKYGKAVNSQGWWRILNVTKDGQKETTMHAERLVGFKGDFVAPTIKPVQPDQKVPAEDPAEDPVEEIGG